MRVLLLKLLLVFSCAAFLIVNLMPAPLPWKQANLGTWEKRKGRSMHKVETTRYTPVNSSQSVRVVRRPSRLGSASKSKRGNDPFDGGYPETEFTPHVKELLKMIDLNGDCGSVFNLAVLTPYSVPLVQCPKQDVVTRSWCAVLERIFLEQRRILPSNVTLSISRGDRVDVGTEFQYKCFANSAPNGEYCMTNFLEMERTKNRKEYPIIPWENRSSIPIWRGKPWWVHDDDNLVTDPSKVYEDALYRSPRLQVVAWSLDNPKLLDAKVAELKWLGNHPYWQNKEANGLDRLFTTRSFIPQEQYYTQYQVALVLGGLGAAFRTSIHLSTETAVVLQAWRFEEWFTPMMKPFEHYIPLAEDFSNLEERMQWISKNPGKVREIGKKGRKFYERYLSFEKNEDHIAELAFRMALLQSDQRENLEAK